MAEGEKTVEESSAPPRPKISVDYRPGRWGKVYHIFDSNNRELVLSQKEAVELAKAIIKIAGQK